MLSLPRRLYAGSMWGLKGGAEVHIGAGMNPPVCMETKVLYATLARQPHGSPQNGLSEDRERPWKIAR